MHLINVHGEEVEILRRDDEVYPHIPQIESLLGGIATEMGVCCSLFWPGTPALPSICFEVDPRPSETRSCPSIPSRDVHPLLLRAIDKPVLDCACSASA